jgi:septation ring formation regulator EzrA
MSNQLDTRELAERLDELSELRDAVETAESELDDARNALSDAESKEEVDEKEVEEALTNFNTAKSAFVEAQSEFGSDEKAELDELEELESEIPEFRDGTQMISVDDFTEAMQEMLEDVGELPKNLPSYIVIDWEATADNLKADYTEVTYQGESYLVRST